MRKFWFAYLAKAVVVMPGGFGTLDEFFELLTLVQTGKIRKKMPIVLFGRRYWSEVIKMEALERYGTINAQDREISEESREGKKGDSTCRYRCTPYHEKKK